MSVEFRNISKKRAGDGTDKLGDGIGNSGTGQMSLWME
jgi:hypothetical protein